MKLLIFILFGSLLAFQDRQETRLPEPSGNYLIGLDYLSLSDKSRKELFDNSQNRFRDLTVKVWYPADTKADYESYLENADFAISNFQFSEGYRTLMTNSCRGVHISQAKKTFPVLIFSHGWGEHFSQNTILMEELASHGYIIFSIAHHYECKFSFYPDGRIISLDIESERFNQLLREQQNPAAMELFQKMFEAKTDDERSMVFAETSKVMPTLLFESPKYWAQDIEFLVNELNTINNTNEKYKGKLDLGNVGVFGMSMGGIAANEVCINNSNIKAGVNIDGGLYGSILDTVINTPYMFINSQRYLGYGNLFVKKSSNDCYSVTVRNSDHYNFTDYALYPTQTPVMVGTINASVPLEIMNSLILNFFNKYLKQENYQDLSAVSQKYDVEFVSAMKND